MSTLDSLRPEERRCLAAARDWIARAEGSDPRAVAAAVLTDSGRLHMALNLDHAQDWGEMCAETGAVSETVLAEPGAKVVFSVAVNRRGVVLAPCEVCLDLFTEYGPAARIALPDPHAAEGAGCLPLAALRRRMAVRRQALGVILAGGQATRMGGGDKGLRMVAGRPLLSHVIERLTPQVAGLALNANGDPGRFEGLDLPVIPDSLPGYAGPLAGVLAGLDWAADRGARAIVTVAADTPFFPRDLVAGLAAAAPPSGLCLAASLDAEGHAQRHPTFGLWPVALRDDLRVALQGGLRKVVQWTDRHGAGQALFDSAPFDPFFNVNTPDDLARADALALAHAP